MVTREARAVIGRIRSRFRSRGLEWVHAVMTFLWGLFVLGNSGQFNRPGFIAFTGGPALWGWARILGRVRRIAALCINGYMARPTALVHVITGVSGILPFRRHQPGLPVFVGVEHRPRDVSVVGFFGLFSICWAIRRRHSG
jgi:hypothetical protein